MPMYNYYCVECQFVFEESFKKIEDVTTPCPKCQNSADRMVSAPNISRSNTSRENLDIMVGKESERRWSDLKQRQEQKSKLRKETGTTALEVVHGRDSASGKITYEYKPVSKERITERKDLYGDYLSKKKP